MAGDSLGSLVIKISSDISEMKSGMDKAAYHAEQTFKTISDAGKKLEATLGAAMKGLAAGLVTGLSVSAIKSFVDETVAATAALQQMAEKTGATVESLSAIRSIAKLSATDMAGVETALIRMTKGMTGAGDETKGFGGALAYLGVTARDSQGNLKSTDTLFLELSKSLDRYADGAGKTALAQALFGKSGAQMIPVLKDLAIVGEYNAKITTAQAEAADEYEKNLKRLSAIKSTVSRQIVTETIPAMNDLAVIMIRAAKESDGLLAQLGNLVKDGSIKAWADDAAMFVARFADTFIGAIAEIKVAYAQLLVAASSFSLHLAQLATAGTSNPLTRYFAEQLDNNRKYLETLEEQAKKANSYYQTLLGQQQAGRREGENLSGLDRVGQLYGAKPQAQPNFAGEDAAKKAAAELAAALKYYGEVLGQLNGVEKAYTDGMEKLLLLYNKRIISTQQLAAAEKFLYSTRTAAGQEIARLTLENKKIDDQIDLIKGVGVSLTGANEAAANFEVTYGKLKNAYQSEKDAITDLARKLDLRNKEKTALDEVAAAHRRLVEEMIREFDQERLVGEQITRNNNAEYERAFATNQGLANEIRMIGLTALEREKALAQLERENALKLAGMLTDEAVKESQIKAINAVYDERNRLLDLKSERTRLLEWTNGLTDAILSAFENGKDGVRGFLDWLKKQFTALVLRPIIQPIISSAAGAVLSLVGMGVSGTAGASGSSAGGIGNLFSLGSGVYNNGSAGLGWLTGGSGYSQAGVFAGESAMQGVSYANPSFWSAGSFGNVGTAGGILGTAALGALGGSVIASSISKDEDASRNGAIAGAAGSVIGAYVTAGSFLGPWGAVIGAIVGGLVAAFSDMDGPAMRTATVIAGQTLDKYTYSLESKLGTLGIARGSDKWFSDSEMGTTLTDWFKTIQNIDNAIADRLSAAQLAAAKLAVGGQSLNLGFGIEHQDVDPTAFGRIVQDRYGKLFASIDEAMGALVTGFEGTTGDLLKLVDDLATVNYQLTTNGAALAKVFGETIDFADLQKLNVAGEAYAATLERIGQVYYATNALAVMFGKSQEEVWGAVGLASESARQALIEAAGGLDAFTSRLNSFYQHYYTAEERLMHTHDALAATFAGLNFEMPTTLAAFRALVQNIVSGVNPALSLQTEAGRAAYNTLLSIEGQFYDFINATTKAEQGTAELTDRLVDLSDVIKGFGNPPLPWTGPGTRDDVFWGIHPTEPVFPRGPIDAMDDTAKAAQEAHDALVKLNETLTNSFKDAYRSIEMAGLSNQAQYEYLQREAAGYVLNLQGATTGEAVQNWAEKIKSDMLSAFNLLSPDEQGARRQEFLDNLLKVSQMVTDRLAALDPLGTLGSSGANVSPAQAAATAQVDAATGQREAAAMQKEAVAEFMDAVRAFALAQSIPKQVALVGGGGTVEAGG